MLLICILFRTCFTCRYANEFLPLCSQDEALRIWAMTLDVVKHQIVRAQRKNRTLNRIALLQVSIENLESNGGAGCSMKNHRMQGCDTRTCLCSVRVRAYMGLNSTYVLLWSMCASMSEYLYISFVLVSFWDKYQVEFPRGRCIKALFDHHKPESNIW